MTTRTEPKPELSSLDLTAYSDERLEAFHAYATAQLTSAFHSAWAKDALRAIQDEAERRLDLMLARAVSA